MMFVVPEFGEVDKMLVQDMLAERAKLREGIQDPLRLGGLGLVAIIAFAANRPGPTSHPDLSLIEAVWNTDRFLTVSGLTTILLTGACIRLIEQMKRLKAFNQRLSRSLSRWGQTVDDDDVLQYGIFLRNSMLCMVTVLLMFTGVASYISRNAHNYERAHPEKFMTKKPSSPPPPAAAPPAQVVKP